MSPITPDEVAANKRNVIPQAVFDIVDRLLTEKFSNGRATIKQEEIVTALVAKGYNRNEIFDRHWLDFEEVYRSAGWKVEYDKPGYNESYDAFFVFTKKP